MSQARTELSERKSRASDSSARAWLPKGAVAVAGVVFVGAVGAYLLASPRTPAALMVGNFTILFAAVLAACSCALASRIVPVDRRAWAVLSVAVILWVCAQMAWTYFGLTREDTYPFPSLADVGYLGFGPVAVAALFLFRRASDQQSLRVRAILDAALIAAAVAFVSYVLVLHSITHDFGVGGDQFEGAVEMAYPLVALITVALVLALGMHRPAGDRMPWLFLGAGLTVLAVTDSIYVSRVHAGDTAVTGTSLTLGWIIAWLLIAVAPWAPRAPSGRRVRRGEALAIDLIPFIALVIAIVVLSQVSIDEPVEFGLLGLLIAAATARQVVVTLAGLDFTRLLEDKVSERTQELETARVEALEASRMKSDFLATMSHEIRTPMNGVLGLSELLLRTELDDKQRKYAQGVNSAGSALLSIINEILDFSKIEAGKLELESIDFNLVQIVEEAAGLVAETAQSKQLELLAYCSPELPHILRGDPSRLRQVLLNLLSNAVKFTSQGEVLARVLVEDQTPTGTVVARFEVVDTGVGIDAHARSQLFEPFTQAASSTTRHFGGTGLGLAICHQLVTAMGGDIGVDSEPGSGSTFWFTLPLEPAHNPEVTHSRSNDALAGLRVLVVDDNETNRLILGEQLSAWGMKTDLAVDGVSAIRLLDEAAQSGSPHELALLDLCMPEMNGLELARNITHGSTPCPANLVLMTSGLDITTEEAQYAGISAQLAKPVHSSILRRTLEDVTGREVSTAPTRVTKAPCPPPGSRGHVLVVEDNHVNQLVALGILEHLGYSSEVAANGIEALEALARTPFAGVLMDCQMPEMDGYAATEQFRSHESTDPRLPIIAMTASATEDERERCLQVGMDDFLTKPVDSDSVASVLERWIVVPSAGEAVAPLDQALDGAEVVDASRLQMLHDLNPGDPSLLDTIVASFLDTSRQTLLDLEHAVSAKDAPEIVALAHRLKGSALNLGLPRITKLCNTVEHLGESRHFEPVSSALVMLRDELELASDALHALPFHHE